MGKTKRLWVPIEPYDILAMKEWLEEKAKEGYLLKNMKSYFSVFEETERQDIKYHLEPTVKDSFKPMDDILESRRERGWTYAGTLTDHFHVFRAPSGAGDFHGDGQAVRWKMEEKLKKERRGLLWRIPLFLYVFLFQMGLWSLFNGPLIWLIEGFSFIHLLAFVPLLLGVFSQYLTYRHHKRILERMKSNDDVYYETSNHFRLLGFIGKGLVLAAISAILLSAVIETSGDRNLGSMTKIDQSPFIHIEAIELLENPSISESKFLKYYNHSGSSSTLFLKERLYLNQTANIGLVEHYYSDLSAVYYEPRVKKAAEILALQTRNRAEEHSGVAGNTEVLNGFSITYYHGVDVQYLVLDNDEQLLEIRYYGDADLSEWKEEFTEKLKGYKNIQS